LAQNHAHTDIQWDFIGFQTVLNGFCLVSRRFCRGFDEVLIRFSQVLNRFCMVLF
jgi:hypothetical protein